MRKSRLKKYLYTTLFIILLFFVSLLIGDLIIYTLTIFAILHKKAYNIAFVISIILLLTVYVLLKIFRTRKRKMKKAFLSVIKIIGNIGLFGITIYILYHILSINIRIIKQLLH